MNGPGAVSRHELGQISLRQDEVHVWRAELELAESLGRRLVQSLSPDERQRAARFRVAGERRRFVLARGLLRALLGRYLGESPAALRFAYGPQGKPALATAGTRDQLRFNVSHSGGLALYAVALGRDVGVDLERISPGRASDSIADSFLSSRELAVLRSLPLHQRAGAFFGCWTRKEAFVKAMGPGLSLPLDRVEVPVTSGSPVAVPSLDGRASPGWLLRDLDVGPDCAAALVVAGSVASVRLLDLVAC